MNQGAEMYYQPHITAGQAPPPQTVTSSSMSYGHQPPLLQPGPAQYPAPPHYGQYPYPNGLTSPPNPPAVPNSLAGNVLPLPTVATQNFQGFDTTGQIAPPGMKPRVTATLWEDEGSLCFQVEAKGICVARREDNHMINGTKLLNVAGMTRGRRDGILKSEKVRHVVKIGPMHLKGVWIPFERALDFANKEKITELLYPLFVHNIGALLYHPTNQNRTNQVMAAAERRKQEQQNQMRSQQAGQPQGLPSIGQHHHHSMAQPAPGQMGGPQHAGMGRPPMDRAHTFPTPPTSASSLVGGGVSQSDYQWQQGMNGAQGAPPMSIDTGLSNARSMPTTPATTPPGATIQSMQQAYPGAPSAQPYDSSRQPQMYSAAPPSQPSPYQTSNGGAPHDGRSLYGAPSGPYVKSEMGPPASRPVEPTQDSKQQPNGLMHGESGAPGHHGGPEHDEGEHDHEAEYTHDSSAYDANRAAATAQYNYGPPSAVASMQAEHPHLSPEMTGSPNHQAGSGRATPRSAAQPQPYYTAAPQQGGGYTTPPRGAVQPPPPSSSLYSVMDPTHRPTNGASDPYGQSAASAPQQAPDMHNGGSYPPPQSQQQQQIMNGGGGIKRSRDDDDGELSRPGSGGPGSVGDLKRRKTGGMLDGGVAAPSYSAINQPAGSIAQRRR